MNRRKIYSGILISPSFVFFLKPLIYIKLLLILLIELRYLKVVHLSRLILMCFLCSLMVILSFDKLHNENFLSFYIPMVIKIIIFFFFSSRDQMSSVVKIDGLRYLIFLITIPLTFQLMQDSNIVYQLYSTQNTAFGLGGRPSSIFDSPVTYSTCLSILCIVMIFTSQRKVYLVLCLMLLLSGGGRISIIYVGILICVMLYKRKIPLYILPMLLSLVIFIGYQNAELTKQFLSILSKIYLLVGICPISTCDTATSSINNRLLSYSVLYSNMDFRNILWGYLDIEDYGLFESGIPLLLVLGGVPLFLIYYYSLKLFVDTIIGGAWIFYFLLIADIFVNASSLPGVIIFLFIVKVFAPNRVRCNRRISVASTQSLAQK